MLAKVAANDAALDADRLAAGNGTKVLDFDLARDGRIAFGSNCLAHGFVEQRGNDAAMEVAGVPAECVGDDGKADDRAIGGEHELEMEPSEIGWPTTETAIVS